MEIALLVLLVTLIVWAKNALTGKIQDQHTQFKVMTEELRALRTEISSLRQADTPPFPAPGPLPAEPEIAAPPVAPTARESAELPPALPPPVEVPVSYPEEEYVSVAKTRTKEYGREEAYAGSSFRPRPLRPEPVAKKEPEPSFFAAFLQQNPDLEKFIGENLINKIGIAILVLGIGYFVKFAIDQDWINEIGRVTIGVLAGGLLLGLAHRLRQNFAAFSSVLVGGGLAVQYFTIAIAFHEYQLLSQTAAFGVMVVITGFAVLLAVAYDRVELAVLAVLGGFATPFMVSTGEGNYQVLFTYILILNTGMLVLAYLKGWRLLNWVSYGCTVLLYGGWLGTRVLPVEDGPYLGALVFGTLFYLIFFLMNIVNNIKERTRFAPADIFILLSNTFFYYAAGMLLLQYLQEGMFRGLFTVALALVNFGFAFAFFRSGRVDRNLVYLLIGLVITFISLAVPVQLEGNFITMFWALEAVLLLWLAQQSGLRFIGSASVLVLGLMLISLVMDWQNLYFLPSGETTLRVLLNKGFITGALAIGAVAATSLLLRRQPTPLSFKIGDLEPALYRQALGVLLGALVYLVGWLELDYQLAVHVDSRQARTIIQGSYNLLYLLGLLGYASYRRTPKLAVGASMLALLGVFLYLVAYSPAVMRLLENHFLYSAPVRTGFSFHYLSLGLVTLLLVLLFHLRHSLLGAWPRLRQPMLWLLGFTVVYISSAELLFHVVYFQTPVANLTDVNDFDQHVAIMESFWGRIWQTNKVGFPILWGVCAFVGMYIGLKRKDRSLRIIALTLFSLTLLKLFAYDIRGISEGGKIAAFISLGVLLLVISFMYQNLKRLILADEPPSVATEE